MDPNNWPTVPFAALGKGTGVSWPYIEQTKGHFNWSRLDKFVSLAMAHGQSILFSESAVPPWAASDKSSCHQRIPFGSYCSSMVSNVADWETFFRVLVTRYKGRIQVHQLWNEPYNSFTGTMKQFVMLTQSEHDIIRSIDPAAEILLLSPRSYGAIYLDQYFKQGGTTDIDAIAIHGYPYSA